MSTFKNNCPNGHGYMPLTKKTNTIKFRGFDITYEKECYTCPECGLEAGTIEQAAAVQKAILNIYNNILANMNSSRSLRLEKITASAALA